MKNALTISNFVFFLLIFGTTVNTSAKTIYYVKQNGTGDGSSWTKAAGNIQAMIDKTVSGDEVWVAKGVYFPTTETIARDNRSKTFIPKNGVNLYGGFAGSESAVKQRVLADLDSNGKIDSFEFVNKTLLSGNIDGVTDLWTKTINTDGKTWNWNVSGNENNCYHVISSINQFNNVTWVDGFQIKGGNANLTNDNNGGGIKDFSGKLIINKCIIEDCSATGSGGGIWAQNEIHNCYINRCVANSGGGLTFENEIVFYDRFFVKITDCFISNCTANKGGGIFVKNNIVANVDNAKSYIYIMNCSLENCSGTTGGGIHSEFMIQPQYSGGGAYTIISDNSIKGCNAYNGGGVSVTSTNLNTGGSISVEECLINNCFAVKNGGGIYFNDADQISGYVTNCTVVNCSAEVGGGINMNLPYSGVTSSAIVNCSANKIGGFYFKDNRGIPFIRGCLFSSNLNDNLSDLLGGKIYDCIFSEPNICFVKPSSFKGIAISKEQIDELKTTDWHLREGSPCIFAGLGKVIDIGAFVYEIPIISLPIVEDFDNWTDFEKSSVFYKANQHNTVNLMKWVIENKKAVFSWKTNYTTNYKESFFTYKIDPEQILPIYLKYDMYFEAYSGTVAPLGTEKLTIEISIDLRNWSPITEYSNMNGTIKNKSYLHDLSKVVSKPFYIRFTANGVNSNRIEKWEIDNVRIDSNSSIPTVVNEIQRESFKYYIANGVIHIHNIYNTSAIQLIDINGRIIANQKLTSNSLQIPLPCRGTYFMRMKSESGFATQKIIW